jgi:hypothetical protein
MSMNEITYCEMPSATTLEQSWSRWQMDVLHIIRSDFVGVLEAVGWDDVDWSAWRPLFDQGYSAHDAVHSAFGRVA